jgi:hypothetical protein
VSIVLTLVVVAGIPNRGRLDSEFALLDV